MGRTGLINAASHIRHILLTKYCYYTVVANPACRLLDKRSNALGKHTKDTQRHNKSLQLAFGDDETNPKHEKKQRETKQALAAATKDGPTLCSDAHKKFSW